MKRLRFGFISPHPDKPDKIALLALSRPEKLNAIDSEFCQEFSECLEKVAAEPNCRALIIKADGKHFCAGADIDWLLSAKTARRLEVFVESTIFVRMYDQLKDLAIPTICITHGAASGGGLGIVACCDIVIAAEGARFSFNEVRVGLYPSILLPLVAKRMPLRSIRRFALTGEEMTEFEGQEYGLVDVISSGHDLDTTVRHELNQVLAGSGTAQANFKMFFNRLESKRFGHAEMTKEAFANVRINLQGQEGLKRFLDKKPQPWTIKMGLSFSIMKEFENLGRAEKKMKLAK